MTTPTPALRSAIKNALGVVPVESTSHRGVTVDVSDHLTEKVMSVLTPFLAPAPVEQARGEPCPECFGGVVPVFHGDTTSEEPCPKCQASWADKAAREIALWVCQRDDNRTEHDAPTYAAIITRHFQSLATEKATSSPGETGGEANDIRVAQVEAGEQAVIAKLRKQGLLPNPNDEANAPKHPYPLTIQRDNLELEPDTNIDTSQRLTCVCSAPETSGVVHRKDGPCYHTQSQTPMTPTPRSDALAHKLEGETTGIALCHFHILACALEQELDALNGQFAVAKKEHVEHVLELDRLCDSRNDFADRLATMTREREALETALAAYRLARQPDQRQGEGV